MIESLRCTVDGKSTYKYVCIELKNCVKDTSQGVKESLFCELPNDVHCEYFVSELIQCSQHIHLFFITLQTTA